MKKYLLLIVGLPFQTAFAQPVLNNSDVGYMVGENFQAHHGDWMDPGSAGANQTWDFTSFTETSNFTISFVDPSTVSSGSAFPTATVAMEISSASYLRFMSPIQM